MAGFIISIEGIDGAGKNTQSNMLKESLIRAGYKAEVISYPSYHLKYGKILGAFLKGKLKIKVNELFFLYLIDMVSTSETVKDLLNNDFVVITDRYMFSTVAYQVAGGFDYDTAKQIELLTGLTMPVVVFLLDVPYSASFERKKKQKKGGLDKFEKDRAYLEEVREAFRRLAYEGFGTKNWVVIDGLENKEAVHRKIDVVVKGILKKR